MCLRLEHPPLVLLVLLLRPVACSGLACSSSCHQTQLRMRVRRPPTPTRAGDQGTTSQPQTVRKGCSTLRYRFCSGGQARRPQQMSLRTNAQFIWRLSELLPKPETCETVPWTFYADCFQDMIIGHLPPHL
jgi:hypothetical protein